MYTFIHTYMQFLMKIFIDNFSGEILLTLNWPPSHYCYQEWRKPDIEIMVVSLTYSANFLKTIGQILFLSNISTT